MRVSRLYIPVALAAGQPLELDEESGHYLRTVLRLKKDDAIMLFNGEGVEYLSQVAEMTRKSVLITVGDGQSRDVESPLRVNLGLGIARGDRMDWSVQKAVELGVNHITPLLTERCVVQFKGDKKPQRWLHWQKIIYHAAEQSGRTYMPELAEVQSLSNWLLIPHGLKLFLDPHAQCSLAELQPDNKQVTLLTGPEGGFSEQERSLAKAAGFIPVRMGKRILRAETAALTALAAVQMLWGDFAV